MAMGIYTPKRLLLSLKGTAKVSFPSSLKGWLSKGKTTSLFII